ncbi:MAG: enoyl-CoA hydratase [Microthrixaceae bacterium]
MAQIRIERTEDRVALVTLDDPQRRNALSLGLCGELVSAIESLEEDPTVGAVVVTGDGPAFCAGADLTQLGDSARDGLLEIYEGFLAVARCSMPTVAAVNGPAVGAGMNLALACDLRVAGPSARFDCRFLDLGIHPGGGHTWMLRRIVGPQTAAAMVLFGEKLDATGAFERGLVWKVTGEDELVERSVQLAAAAASVPPDLSTDAKATLSEVAALEDHGEAVELELAKQLESMRRPEFAERLAKLKRSVSRSTSD